jgi:hypothetical protein
MPQPIPLLDRQQLRKREAPASAQLSAWVTQSRLPGWGLLWRLRAYVC